MQAGGIFDRTFTILGKVLDLRSMKHELIASNIANVDTPNYKAFDMVIEEEMGKIIGGEKDLDLMRTEPAHLPGTWTNLDDIHPMVVESSQEMQRGDRNTVNIDKEMANLAENSLMYNVSAQILSKKFQELRDAIQGGNQ